MNYIKKYKDLVNNIITSDIHNRTYEDTNTYLFVFQPYKTKYEKDVTYYQTTRFIEDVKKFINSRFSNIEYSFITREIIATQIHVNAMVISNSIINIKTEGHYNTHFGYKLFIDNAYINTRERLTRYIFKEMKEREFKYYLDYAFINYSITHYVYNEKTNTESTTFNNFVRVNAPWLSPAHSHKFIIPNKINTPKA